MIQQGSGSSKLNDGLGKTPEKNIASKICQKNTKLPEKTKFTLQYHSICSSRTLQKNGERRIIRPGATMQDAQTQKSTPRTEISRSILNSAQRPINRDQTIAARDSDKSKLTMVKLREERQVKTATCSVPFFSGSSTTAAKSYSGTYKRVESGMRKPMKSSIVKKVAPESKTAFVLPKPECSQLNSSNGLVRKLPPSPKKLDMKVSCAKTNLKKTSVFPSGMRLGKLPATGPKTAQVTPKNTPTHGTDTKNDTPDQKTEKKSRSDSKSPRRLQSAGKVLADPVSLKPKAHDQVRQDHMSLDKTMECLTADPKLSPEKMELDNAAQSTGVPVNPFPRQGSFKTDLKVAKNHVLHVHNAHVVVTGEDVKESKEETDNDDLDLFEMTAANPLEVYDSFDSVERTNPNDDLSNLDTRVWSGLEVQIRETCEKPDFLDESGGDSDDSLSEIINLYLPHDDHETPLDDSDEAHGSDLPPLADKDSEALADVAAKPKSAGPESTVKIVRDQSKSREDVKVKVNDDGKQKTSDPPFKSRNLSPSPKRGKSAEDDKTLTQTAVSDVKKEKVKEGKVDDSKLCHVIQESNKGVVRERMTVTFKDATQPKRIVNDDVMSPGFFKTHDNVEFIGRDIDQECISFDLGQVTLYQPNECYMLLYDIANCTATQAYLKMCGIKFDLETRKNAEHMSPSGRVPFISSGLCIIPEFEAIVSFMQYKKYTCIRVEDADKPAFRNLITMIWDTLEVAERYICWYDEGTIQTYTKPRASQQYPFPLNHIMHFKKRIEERRRLVEQRILGKPMDEVLSDVYACFRTLSQRLGDKKFFFGEVCTEIDALVYGHVYALFTSNVNGPFKDIRFIIKLFPNLIYFSLNFDKMFSLDKFSSVDTSYWEAKQAAEEARDVTLV